MRSFLMALALSSTASAHAELRVIAPADLSVPDPAALRVEGARPKARITITTMRQSYDGKDSYVATATFVADRDGRVDVSKARAEAGTYRGVDPLGLFWSGKARPLLASDPVAGVVGITAEAKGAVVARAKAATEPNSATLTIRRDTPFPGAVWALPRTAGPHPVVIILGGSEGGSSVAREMAPRFAARGYAALGLPYYDPGYDPTDRVAGLPTNFTEIPVDRLAAVRDWLAAQPEADSARIGVWGASKGAEFALIASSRYGWIKAIAAIVPSDLVWEGWGAAGPSRSSFSFGGVPLAFQPYAGMDVEMAKAAKGVAMDLRRVHAAGRLAFPERVAAARIPVEAYKGALLVAAGGRDTVWPSADMASRIVATRTAAGLATEAFMAADAGHSLAGPGTSPSEPLMANGGYARMIAHTRADVWRATFAMFDHVLKP